MRNGITFTDNGDGSITINGFAEGEADKPNASSWFRLFSYEEAQSFKNVVLSGGLDKNIFIRYTYVDENGENKAVDNKNGDKLIIENAKIKFLTLHIAAGTVVDNVTVYPQLEKGW